MYDSAFENYKNVYKDLSEAEYKKAIRKEVIADLVGEYIFNDADFVRNLSTKNPNVFQKVYNEIKYLLKSATTGSDAEKQLLKAKKMFEDVYRDTKKNTSEKTQYKLVGKEDGIEVYETSEETQKLSYTERKAKLLDVMVNEYSGRTAKFTKNGNTYYAMYDKSGVKKGIHGDNKSDKKGYKAKINIGADGNYIELAENSLYKGSSIEQGKDNKFHKNAQSWDYYVKTIKSDGNYFDVLINVKDTGNEHYVYDITLKEATSLPDQLRSYDGNSIASNTKIPQSEQKASKKSQQDNKIQYSVTDNKGRTLTKEQQEKFKDSVVRDKDGNLLTMYHGTPNGDYTIFREGTYFTQNKEYADVYQSQGASSLGYKKTANNPKTYEVYLDIKSLMILQIWRDVKPEVSVKE